MKINYINLSAKIFVLLMVTTWFQSCSEDDSIKDDNQIIVEDPVIEDPDNEDPTNEDPEFTPEGVVEVLNADKIDDNYILVNDAAANRVFLMNKEARLLHEWPLTNNIGNDVFLLPNGKLLGSLEADDPQIPLGGKGGKLQFIAPDGTVEWNFLYSSVEGETHHDAELLPNGNIIAMVWGKRTTEDALQNGFMLANDVVVESIIEVDPTTDEIVWEWHSWDHLIQDFDETKDNYGLISEHPEKIDINYFVGLEGAADTEEDIMHANGIAYDEINDVILLSVNIYSEIWVIDHSTSAEEAASQSGGTYGKGGDLIYRFGNPEAYKNPEGTRLFHNNHFPNLLEGEDQGKLLVFSNGNDILQSAVYELQLPDVYELQPNSNNEPEITWSFTDTDLYSGKVSGAVPLPNGNVLITEGDFGFWEVTRDSEVVWKFSTEGFFWRGYHYSKSAPEILALDL